MTCTKVMMVRLPPRESDPTHLRLLAILCNVLWDAAAGHWVIPVRGWLNTRKTTTTVMVL